VRLVEMPLSCNNKPSRSDNCPLLQLRTVTRIELVKIAMQFLPTPTNKSILEHVISLAHFGKQQRILIAGREKYRADV
jgi:hypothetical protein